MISYCGHVTLCRGNLIEIEGKARAARGTLCLDQLLSGIVQAWPNKLTGPSANATNNEVGIEELEITHEGYTRVS